MRLLDRLSARSSVPQLSLSDYLKVVNDSFAYGGNQYPMGVQFSMQGSPAQTIDGNFEAIVHGVGERHGLVAAAVYARQALVSQLRFRWRSLSEFDNGRLFGTQELALLERPGSMTRPELLATAESHASYAGTAYFYRPRGGGLGLLRPDWTAIVAASEMWEQAGGEGVPFDYPDAEVVEYLHRPGGRGRIVRIPPTEVRPWRPEPHPMRPWIGSSWVTSVLTEIVTDQQATEHIGNFYEHAATPQLVFTFDPSISAEQVKEYAALTNTQHAGAANAYRNMFIGGGADVKAVGANIEQLNYSDTQGGHETRIASRSRVPAVILGIREGMQGSALNAGNYNSTRRLWADTWFSSHADSLCAAVEPFLAAPKGGPSELTYDPAAIRFLQEDRKDEADIRQADAITARQLTDAGFTPETVVKAVTTGDFSVLKHSGLPPVQVQAQQVKQGQSTPDPSSQESA